MMLQHGFTMKENLGFLVMVTVRAKAAEVYHYLAWSQVVQTHV